MNVAAIDTDLNDVKLEKRLPYFELGEYLIELTSVSRSDKNGIFDIFETRILESKGEEANAAGTEAKILIQRDATPDWKRESRERELVSLLAAINGGEDLEDRKEFLAGLRTAVPEGTKFRLVIREKFKPRYSAA